MRRVASLTLAALLPLGLALGLPFGGGCVHHIVVSSDPPGAMASFNGAAVGRLPAEVLVRPFERRALAVTLVGFRPMTLTLARTGTMSFVGDLLTLHWPRGLGITPYATVELEMIEEHGPIGTWAPEELR